MSQRTETICDMCGASKGESNRWWVVRVKDEGWFTVLKVVQSNPKDKDYCSESCVSKALSQFMTQSSYYAITRSPEDEIVEELDTMLKRAPIEEDEDVPF